MKENTIKTFTMRYLFTEAGYLSDLVGSCKGGSQGAQGANKILSVWRGDWWRGILKSITQSAKIC